MHYNWKCCSFYPNNFGASALGLHLQLSSTGQWKHIHRPVGTRLLTSGNTSTGQWTTTESANLINCSCGLTILVDHFNLYS